MNPAPSTTERSRVEERWSSRQDEQAQLLLQCRTFKTGPLGDSRTEKELLISCPAWGNGSDPHCGSKRHGRGATRNQHKLRKPHILCFGAFLITVSHRIGMHTCVTLRLTVESPLDILASTTKSCLRVCLRFPPCASIYNEAHTSKRRLG